MAHAAASPAAGHACAHDGCRNAALFRPVFAYTVGSDDRHVRLGTMPLDVCAAHREHIVRLFRDPRTLARLRRELAAGAPRPIHIRVVFQVVQ